jgi:alanyl-tRNA synthetase
MVTSEEAARLPLRKDLSRDGELRLIEIEGFDLTPCGGTHAYRTGEVGMIAVRHWERAKGLTRIEFAAGTRALTDYRRANKTARAVAALFSSGRDDAPKLTARILEENKELHRRLRTLEEVAARVEADELLARASAGVGDTDSAQTGASHTRVIARIFDNRDGESLKRLALALVAHPQMIALLGSRNKDAARLVFARSADSSGDMNALMREACAILDGHGGGKSDLAQGGGKNVEKLSDALDVAARALPGE